MREIDSITLPERDRDGSYFLEVYVEGKWEKRFFDTYTEANAYYRGWTQVALD